MQTDQARSVWSFRRPRRGGLAAALVVVAALLLTACGSKEAAPAADGPSPECLARSREAEPDQILSYTRICERCARTGSAIERTWSCGLRPVVETTEQLDDGSLLWTRTGGPTNPGCAHVWHRLGGSSSDKDGHGTLWVQLDSRTVRRFSGTETGVAALTEYAGKTARTPLAVFGTLVRYAATREGGGYVWPFEELTAAVDAGAPPREPTAAAIVDWLERNRVLVEERAARYRPSE